MYQSLTEGRRLLDPREDGAVLWLCRPRRPSPCWPLPPSAALRAPAATLSTVLLLEGNAEEGTAVSLLYCLQLSLNLQLPQRLKF